MEDTNYDEKFEIAIASYYVESRFEGVQNGLLVVVDGNAEPWLKAFRTGIHKVVVKRGASFKPDRLRG